MNNKSSNSASLLIGSNQGDRKQNLMLAVKLISDKAGEIVARSSIYSTEPWGFSEQEDFLNMAVEIKTNLSIRELLNCCKELEKEIGRVATEKWGPRIMDIDIIFYNREIVHEDDLKVPHPALYERKFVLEPLVEIKSDFVHPTLNYTLGELLENCNDKCRVEKYNS